MRIARVDDVGPSLPHRSVRCHRTRVLEVEAGPRHVTALDSINGLEEVVAVFVHVVGFGVSGLECLLGRQDSKELINLVLGGLYLLEIPKSKFEVRAVVEQRPAMLIVPIWRGHPGGQVNAIFITWSG